MSMMSAGGPQLPPPDLRQLPPPDRRSPGSGGYSSGSLMSPAGMHGSLMSTGLQGLPTPSGGYGDSYSGFAERRDSSGSATPVTPVRSQASSPAGICGMPLSMGPSRPRSGGSTPGSDHQHVGQLSPTQVGQGLAFLSVAVDVQQLIEANTFKPVSLVVAESLLQQQSKAILANCNISLEAAIQMHPRMVCTWMHNGTNMVSCPGSPWLGPGPSAPPEHGPAGPSKQHSSEGLQPNDIRTSSKPLKRGTATERMHELAKDQLIQEGLREISLILLSTPGQQLLVSDLGNRISAETRGMMQNIKLRSAQLLRCFPHDFKVDEKGPGSTVKYLHYSPKTHYVPEREQDEVNSMRLARLLKFAKDGAPSDLKASGVHAHEVMQAQRGHCLFVDCRTESERLVSVLPGAVPSGEVTAELLDDYKSVVAYCCVGICSATWCNMLHSNDLDEDVLKRVTFIIGGIAAWAHAGGPLVDAATKKPTQKVHCWSLELAQIFPLNGSYQVTCAIAGGANSSGDPSHTTMLMGLSTASQVRYARLRTLAWEVRLRYCPDVFCVEAEELLRTFGQKESFILVDCRTAPELEVSRIDAQCPVITLAQYEADERRYLNSAQMVITYCTIGGRSGANCSRISKNVQAPAGKFGNLLGGVAAWLHAGGMMSDRSGKRTRRVSPWCRAFMDFFPVEGVELTFDEMQLTPVDALAFVACSSHVETESTSHSGDPEKVLRTCATLPPEVLADSLKRAAMSCEQYTD